MTSTGVAAHATRRNSERVRLDLRGAPAPLVEPHHDREHGRLPRPALRAWPAAQGTGQGRGALLPDRTPVLASADVRLTTALLHALPHHVFILACVNALLHRNSVKDHRTDKSDQRDKATSLLVVVELVNAGAGRSSRIERTLARLDPSPPQLLGASGECPCRAHAAGDDSARCLPSRAADTRVLSRVPRRTVHMRRGSGSPLRLSATRRRGGTLRLRRAWRRESDSSTAASAVPVRWEGRS